MKQYLSNIVQGYDYKNVKSFMANYSVMKAEYGNYRTVVAKQENRRERSWSLKA